MKNGSIEKPGTKVNVLGRTKLRTQDAFFTLPDSKHRDNVLTLLDLWRAKPSRVAGQKIPRTESNTQRVDEDVGERAVAHTSGGVAPRRRALVATAAVRGAVTVRLTGCGILSPPVFQLASVRPARATLASASCQAAEPHDPCKSCGILTNPILFPLSHVLDRLHIRAVVASR